MHPPRLAALPNVFQDDPRMLSHMLLVNLSNRLRSPLALLLHRDLRRAKNPLPKISKCEIVMVDEAGCRRLTPKPVWRAISRDLYLTGSRVHLR